MLHFAALALASFWCIMKIVDKIEEDGTITWIEERRTPAGATRVTKTAKVVDVREVDRSESTTRDNERNG